MEKYIKKASATLEEEKQLLDEMLALADEIREAIVFRSAERLFALGSKQQTLVVRLQIIRQTQEQLTESIREQIDIPSDDGQEQGLAPVLRHISAGEELLQLKVIESKIIELAKANAVNEQLLKKQFHSLSAFQQLLDLVQGVDKVYDRSGDVQTALPRQHFEHKG
jgi:flagellar biosynthesis/type III secretory pathway chaperone